MKASLRITSISSIVAGIFIFPDMAFAAPGGTNPWVIFLQTIQNDLSSATAQYLAAIAVMITGLSLMVAESQSFMKKILRLLFGISIGMNAVTIISYFIGSATTPVPTPVTTPSPDTVTCIGVRGFSCGVNLTVSAIHNVFASLSGYFEAWAIWIFLALAAIELTWTGFLMMLDQGGQDVFPHFVKRLFQLSLFYTIILNSQTWSQYVMDGFSWIGETILGTLNTSNTGKMIAQTISSAYQASPGNSMTGTDISAIISNGLTLAGDALSTIGTSVSLYLLDPYALISDFFVLIGAIMILFGFLFMAWEYVVAMVGVFLMESLGLLFLGFWGSRMTESLAQNFFPKAVSYGVRLLTVMILAKVGNSLAPVYHVLLTPGQVVENVQGMPAAQFAKKFANLATQLANTDPNCLPSAAMTNKLVSSLSAQGYSQNEINSYVSGVGSNQDWKVGNGYCGTEAYRLIQSIPTNNMAGFPEAVMATAMMSVLFGLISLKAPGLAAELLSPGTGGMSPGGIMQAAATTAIATNAIMSGAKGVTNVIQGAQSVSRGMAALGGVGGASAALPSSGDSSGGSSTPSAGGNMSDAGQAEGPVRRSNPSSRKR